MPAQFLTSLAATLHQHRPPNTSGRRFEHGFGCGSSTFSISSHSAKRSKITNARTKRHGDDSLDVCNQAHEAFVLMILMMAVQ